MNNTVSGQQSRGREEEILRERYREGERLWDTPAKMREIKGTEEVEKQREREIS